MSEQDYELHHDSAETTPQKPDRPVEWWIAGGLLIVAAAAAAYLVFGNRQVTAPAVTTTSAPAPAAKEPARPLGGEAEAISVPPLADSDPVVRTLVRALSNNPVVASWLATNGLIRGFTVAVSNIAEGSSPAKQLGALRPGGSFPVVETNGVLYLDPRGYARYAKLAGAVESIDAPGAAKLYATLKPRIEEAAGERIAAGPVRRSARTIDRRPAAHARSRPAAAGQAQPGRDRLCLLGRIPRRTERGPEDADSHGSAERADHQDETS